MPPIRFTLHLPRAPDRALALLQRSQLRLGHLQPRRQVENVPLQQLHRLLELLELAARRAAGVGAGALVQVPVLACHQARLLEQASEEELLVALAEPEGELLLGEGEGGVDGSDHSPVD